MRKSDLETADWGFNGRLCQVRRGDHLSRSGSPALFSMVWSSEKNARYGEMLTDSQCQAQRWVGVGGRGRGGEKGDIKG